MTHHGYPAIACKDLRLMQVEGNPKHAILDVRSREEFEAGHVEGSVHVPHNELEGNIESLITDKSHVVVVIIGEEEGHAKEVHEHLTKNGYADVRFLMGGFDEYCKPAEPDVSDIVEEEGEEIHEDPDDLVDETGETEDEDAKYDPLY